MPDLSTYLPRFGRDALASVVVFLVALPLCMGIALASGVPPAAGLVTGIIGGLVVGLIAGAPLQVSGPAAGLTVLVWEIVQTHGLAALGPVVLLAGLIQVAAGLLRVGPWFRAVSPAVVHGMLAGIGVLIFTSQFHVMVDDKPRGSGIANLLSIPEAIWKGVMPVDGSTHHLAAAIGLLTIFAIVAWNTWRPARLKAVPAPLVAVVAAAAIAYVFALPIKYVAIPESLFGGLNGLGLGDLRILGNQALLTSALALAVIASAETLLCATAVDQMHDGPRTDYNRELIAQGVGNALCGWVGGLPMTGVIVRSSANIEAGATSRVSAILHGLWLLAFVLLIPNVLTLIPVASLAAVLVFTGYKLVNPAVFKKLVMESRSEALIYAATIIAIVTTNLLEGIAIGLALVVVKMIGTLTRLDVRVSVQDGHTTVALSGVAVFLSLPKLAMLLDSLAKNQVVHIQLDGLHYLDHACFDLLQRWAAKLDESGGKAVIEWDTLHQAYRRSRPSQTRAPATVVPRRQPATAGHADR